MKDQDDGVRELVLEQERRVFNHCFTGAVDQLSVRVRDTVPVLCVTAGLRLCSVFVVQVPPWWSGWSRRAR